MKQKFEFPALGQRIVRTVIGVFLCFVIFFARGGHGSVFYSVLAVLVCIQPNIKNSFQNGKQRMLGTCIGAFWGLIAILMTHDVIGIDLLSNIYGYLIIAVFTGVTLYTAVLIKQKDAASFSAVVFLSVAATPMVADRDLFWFVGDRFVDTMLGVIVAILVNSLHWPRKRDYHTLFISGIDDIMMVGQHMQPSPFSKVELNHMIEQGLQFSISTWRTPASLLKLTEGINMNLPVVCMSGAAMYDMQNKSFVDTISMKYDKAKRIVDIFQHEHTRYYANVVVDDVLLIFHQGEFLPDEVELYREMNESPYRNYLNRPIPEGEDVLYFMIIENEDKVKRLYNLLNKQPWIDEYHMIFYENEDNSGFSSLKIYDKQAGQQEMLARLKKRIGASNVVVLGSNPHFCDVVVEGQNGNLMVKKLRKLFEPISFSKEGFFQKRDRLH